MPILEPFQDDQVQEKEQTKPWINGFYAVFNAAYELDDSNLDMYAPGDGPRPVTKWISFDDIREVQDMIIGHGPLKGTVNENGPFPNTIYYPIGKNIFETYKIKCIPI